MKNSLRVRVGNIIGLSLRKVPHLPCVISLSNQPRWFHPIWSSLAKVIAVSFSDSGWRASGPNRIFGNRIFPSQSDYPVPAKQSGKTAKDQKFSVLDTTGFLGTGFFHINRIIRFLRREVEIWLRTKRIWYWRYPDFSQPDCSRCIGLSESSGLSGSILNRIIRFK